MRTLSTNSDNDIFLGPDGNLATSTGIKACAESCGHASQVLMGELPYAQSRGIAFMDTSFEAPPDLALYEVQLRRMLLSVPNVLKVNYIAFQIEGTQLSYEAEIKTNFGVETLSGNL